MRYVEKKIEEKKSFSFNIVEPIKVNDEVLTEGSITVYDEEVKDSKIVEKSMKIGEVIIAKGSYIVLGEAKKDLKEDNYGWEIQRGQEWDAYEDAREVFGDEGLLDALVRAMGDNELGENLAYIFRANDYRSPYLK